MNASQVFVLVVCTTALLLLAFVAVAVWQRRFKTAALWLLLGVFYSALFVLGWATLVDPGLKHLLIGDNLSFTPLSLCALSGFLLSLVLQARKTWAHSLGFLFGSLVTTPLWFFACLYFIALASVPVLRY